MRIKLIGEELVSNDAMSSPFGDIESDVYRILLIPPICDVDLWPRSHTSYPVGVLRYTPTGYLVFDGNTQPR